MIEPDNRLNICNRPTCKRPPEGWYCTRPAGHDGPCAALPVKDRHDRDRDLNDFLENRPPTDYEKHMHDLEVQRLEALAYKQESLPTATELLGRQAWSLKCLLQDIRGTSKVIYGEQREDVKLAVHHLEDALHRINLALPDDEQR